MGLNRRALAALVVYSSVFLAQPAVLAQLPYDEARNRAAVLCNESLPLISEGKYDAALSKLAESLNLNPDNASTLSNYGLVLLKMGQMAGARKQLDKALKLDPKLTSGLLNMGLVCEAMGDLASAKSYLLRFIEVSQNKDQVEKMKDHIAIIDKTLAKGAPAVGDGSDYLTEVGRSQMFPWPKDLMPIKIYIAPANEIPGYKPNFGDDLENAISAWSKALDGIVSFTRCSKKEDANIDIHWAHDYKTALMKAEGGDCKYVANGAGMKHADITLLTIDPSASDKLNDAKVSWVALHELGHALGINAHSNNPTDVMYFAAPLASAMPQLSARDVTSFQRLYTQKLPDTWLTLNDSAIKLMRAGQNNEALERLNQAIKMEPAQKVLKENLVIVQQRIAIDFLNAGKYTEAEPYLVNALELEKELKNEFLDDLLADYAQLLKRTGRSEQVDEVYKRYGKTPSKS